MQPLLLPSKVLFEEGDQPTIGRMIVEPCEAGFGTTLGNAFRRVLLSSLPGAAISDIRIEGIEHEFSTVPHVKEDLIQIILNVKQLRLKVHADEPVRLRIAVKGERVVTAGDIEKNADVEIVNPEQVIATLTDASASFTMELIATQGRGYEPTEARDRKSGEIGLLAVDALYTPIRNVGFHVENTRVGQVTNYDKLTVTIETDGTIDARDAVEQSTKILMDHFRLFLNPKDAKSYDNAPLMIENEIAAEEGAEVKQAE